MSVKFDGEDLLDSVLAAMTDGGALNAKIAAIEAEKTAKGKGLTPALGGISDNGYYRQTWTDKILQTKRAVFYGIEDIQANDGGGVVAKTYRVWVDIILIDNGLTQDAANRVMRYTRALEELFTNVYAPAIAGGRIKLEAFAPVGFKLQMNTNEEIKFGGVSLTVTLV